MRSPPTLQKLENLTSIQKRDLLASENLSPENALVYAEFLFGRQGFDDALAFFAKAESQEGIERVKRVALEHGNSGLLFEVARRRPAEVVSADWDQLGDNAVDLGKYAYAVFAYRRSGNDEKRRQAEQHYTPPVRTLDGEKDAS